MEQISTFVTDYPFFLSINIMQQIIKHVVSLKYSKILNISQYNHRLNTTTIILLNLKDKRSKLQ